jgi:molecular chaperone GrpE
MVEPNHKPAPPDGASTARNDQDPGELEQLRAKLAQAEQARDQNLDLARRTQAEFENYQKRAQRDRAQDLRYAQAPLAFDILAILDNLDRAVAAAQQAGETGPLVQGVAMVQSQVLDAFRRHGVTRIEAKGEPFDPNLHQAVMQQPSQDYPPGTVIQVLEHGYRIHDRVLRPARVIVSTAPAEGGPSQ